MKNTILFKIFLTILFSTQFANGQCQYYHEPTGWCFNQSMAQAMYFFNPVFVNGMVPVSGILNGTPTNDCPGGNCDAIAVYCGDMVTGWSYYATDVNGYFTITAMGYDGNENTVGYCFSGQFPNFKIYDYNHDQILETETYYDIIPWQNNSFNDLGMLNGDVNLTIEEITNHEKFELFNIYPNPFNSTTTINYHLPLNAVGKLVIFDLRGSIVSELTLDGKFSQKNIFWNENNFQSGIYFARLKWDSKQLIKKILYLK